MKASAAFVTMCTFCVVCSSTSRPIAAAQTPPDGGSPVTALVGETIVDVGSYGRTTNDVPNAVVLVRGSQIVAAGSRSAVRVPADANVVDLTGKYLLPGLVDGFAGLNSQAHANATLYEGVTTIVGSGDDRRGKLMLDASPSPHVYPIDSAGTTDDYSLLIGDPAWSAKLKDGTTSTELSAADTLAQLQATARLGTRAIWLGHNLTSANVERIVGQAHALGLVTYGEFDATPYADGIRDGVDSLLHMSRIELGLAPAELVAPLVTDPDGPAQDAPYRYIFKLDPNDASVNAYGALIHDRGVALMPTFSLFYLVLPNHRNLWKEEAAAILDPATLHRPPDRATGEATFRTPAGRAQVVSETASYWALERTIEKSQPIYLAASGASAVGTMPGISMHTELELLVRVGLTPREALAAATSNYSAKFGWHELGLVAPGRRADLLVLDADPTVDIANSRKISAVFLDGKAIDRAALLELVPTPAIPPKTATPAPTPAATTKLLPTQ